MDRETPTPIRAAHKDRRFLRDRRRRQQPIAFVDRRESSRRQTELQAFLWHCQQFGT